MLTKADLEAIQRKEDLCILLATRIAAGNVHTSEVRLSVEVSELISMTKRKIYKPQFEVKEAA